MAIVATDTATVAGTTPYPWPWDAGLSSARLAVLVISDGQPLGGGGAGLAAVLLELCTAAQLAEIPAVLVRTAWPDRRPGRPSGVAASSGPGRIDDLPVPWTADVTAAGWDGFYGSPLDALLRSWGRDQLLLCGQQLEIGVHSTLRSANDRGYECLTIAGACTEGTPALAYGALHSIEMSGGIFGSVGGFAEVLAALADLAATPAHATNSDFEVSSL